VSSNYGNPDKENKQLRLHKSGKRLTSKLLKIIFSHFWDVINKFVSFGRSILTVIQNIFGIDIGGSGIKGAPVDIVTGKLLADRFKIKTPIPLGPSGTAEVVSELLEHFAWEGPVGCGFPTNIKDDVALGHSNLHPDWKGQNIKAIFEERTGYPFKVINDADAAGLAEMKFGAGKGVTGLVLMITFGTGIGSGMFYNGQLIQNTELGYLDYKGERYELFAADSARKREKLSYPEWGKRVNQYLKHVELVISPDLIIIGGGASKKMDLFKEELHLDTKVVPAQMLNEAGTVGAAMGYLENF